MPDAQTVKKVLQMAKVIRRLQDSHRIDRLCRLGGEFSVVKCNFTEENIHQPSSKKCLQHFFDTLCSLRQGREQDEAA